MGTRVLVWLSGADEPDVVAAIDGADELQVVRRCADLAEVLAGASAGLGQIAVVHPGRGLDRGRLGELRRAGLRTVLVVAESDQARGAGLGGDAVVTLGTDLPARVVEAVLQVRASAAGQGTDDGTPAATDGASGAAGGADDSTPPDRGALLAVWSAAGSPGRSSVAVNLATELALRSTALLVDADTFAPSLAQALAVLDESAALAGLCRAAGQGTLDAESFARRARTLDSGLTLVTGLTRADRWREASPDALEVVWEEARTFAAWTVVDVGGGLETPPPRGSDRWAATRSVLAAADVVVVVVGCDPVSVRRAVAALGDLDDAGITAERCVVVNRVRSAAAGPRAEEALTEALVRFGAVTPSAFVPDDPAVDGALLVGAALAQHAPRAPARQALAGVADLFLPGAPVGRRQGARARERTERSLPGGAGGRRAARLG